MCTAISLTTRDHYFGRNLDLEYSYQETVAVTPRNFPLTFRHVPDQPTHYALIGMAYVQEGQPLYYEATNEHGLSIAGLNFPASAKYHPLDPQRDNVTPFELIPYLLGQCRTVQEARPLLTRLNLLDEAFSADLPLSPLHWMLDDAHEAIVLESMADGLHVYEAPARVLTNEPPYPMQMRSLVRYRGLSPEEPENTFSRDLPLTADCRGLGAFGMPGDWSSPSRFIKTAFLRQNAVCGESESESISEFFHILGAVAHPRGCVRLGDKYEITVYASCCNATRGIYYYQTVENSQITAIDMHRTDLDSRKIRVYPLVTGQQINWQN